MKHKISRSKQYIYSMYTFFFAQVPTSMCSNICPVGTRKAQKKGEPNCCFDCIACADGTIANSTGIKRMITKSKKHTPSNNIACISCIEYIIVRITATILSHQVQQTAHPVHGNTGPTRGKTSAFQK